MDAIRNRRAVREYTDPPIDRAIIERVINAAILAPGSMNLQPWAFAALLNRERIGEYAGRIKSWLLMKSWYPLCWVTPKLGRSHMGGIPPRLTGSDKAERNPRRRS